MSHLYIITFLVLGSQTNTEELVRKKETPVAKSTSFIGMYLLFKIQ